MKLMKKTEVLMFLVNVSLLLLMMALVMIIEVEHYQMKNILMNFELMKFVCLLVKYDYFVIQYAKQN